MCLSREVEVESSNLHMSVKHYYFFSYISPHIKRNTIRLHRPVYITAIHIYTPQELSSLPSPASTLFPSILQLCSIKKIVKPASLYVSILQK